MDGDSVLSVKVIMNSVMEEILAFKCCNISNQNLEMHVRNEGDHSLTLTGRFVLEKETGILNGGFFPPWPQTLRPGEAVAYYCSMEPLIWEQYETLIIFDDEGRGYRFPIAEITDYALPRE